MNERHEVELDQLDTESQNPDSSRAERLRELFPEAVTEGTGDIDFDKLRELLDKHVSESRERYAFTWPGKHDAIRQSQTPSTATLRPLKEKSVDWDTTENLYIEGDNLEVLKLLQRSYHGQVDVIYIDPPYNTGNDFVYKDSFGDTIENYREQTGQEHASNPETNGRFHSNWLNMMYPRLRLARELLSEHGAIFMSIDDSEAQNLKAIANELFGESNFVAQMVWAAGRKNDSKYVSISHEYVLIYVKNMSALKKDGTVWRKKKDGLDAIYAEYERLKSTHGNDYKSISKELKSWYKGLENDNPSKKHRHYSSADDKGIYFPDNISWPGGGGPRYEVLHPKTYKPVPIPSRGWLFGSPQRMQEMIQEGRVEFGSDEAKIPCYKRYLKETEYEVPYSVIYKDGRAASKRLATLMGSKVFDNPKDEEVIAELLSYVDTPESIILDFFSGSGTSAHATMLRNLSDNGHRRFIMVQLPEDLDSNLASTSKQSSKEVLQNAIALCESLQENHTICTIAEERIRRAAQQLKSNTPPANQPTLDEAAEPLHLDTGFRVFALDSSNLKSDEYTPGQELDIDLVKRGRTNEDLLFEVMLRWGLDLSLPVEMKECNGYEYLSVAEGELVCCMNDGLTVDVIEHIVSADDKPRRVFIPDHVFGGQNNLKLNIVDALRRALSEGQEIELRTV